MSGDGLKDIMAKLEIDQLETVNVAGDLHGTCAVATAPDRKEAPGASQL